LCGLVGRLSLSKDLDWPSARGPELLRWCVQLLAMGSVVDGLFLPSPIDVGELVITRWAASESRTGSAPVLTAVVSIVMVGALCLRTAEGSPSLRSWPGLAMVAEKWVYDVRGERLSAEKSRRSSSLGEGERPMVAPFGVAKKAVRSWVRTRLTPNARVCGGSLLSSHTRDGKQKLVSCKGA
jgi:hypothetical protein